MNANVDEGKPRESLMKYDPPIEVLLSGSIDIGRKSRIFIPKRTIR